MTGLLRLKHWQLFSITFVFPVISGLGVMAFFLARIISIIPEIERAEQSSEPPAILFELYADIIPYFFVPMLFTLIIVLWRYSVVRFLAKEKLPSDYKLNRGLFNAALLVPVLLSVIVLFGFSSFMDSFAGLVDSKPIENSFPTDFFSHILAFALVVLPFSLISLVAQFYTFYETGRAIRSAELQRSVGLNESIIEALLNWFFFIGVWVLQPRVNKLIAQEKDSFRSM